MIQGAAQLLALAMAMAPAPQPHSPYPFAVGERAVYEINAFLLTPGTATMELAGIDTVRGRNAFHFRFVVSGSEFGYGMHDTLQSWADTAELSSLRFHQELHEGGGIFHTFNGKRRYEIFPDRRTYQDASNPEKPSVADPLDDASFLYFVRTQKLEVDSTYTYPRYFKPESNPVTIKVLRRETIKVPLGEFRTVVVQPIIKTSGLFSKGGEAKVWISDDSARMIVQIRTKLPIPGGALTLQLKSYVPYGVAPPPRHP